MSDIKQDVKATVKVFIQMIVSIVVRESTKKMIKNLTERQRKKFEDKIKDLPDDQLAHYFDKNPYFKNALKNTIKSVIKAQSAKKTLSLMGKLQSIFEATSSINHPVSALVLPAPKIILSLVASTAILATAAVPVLVLVSQDTLGFPAANFSSNITSGYPPLSVRFTDLSQNATALEWEFGDGTTSNEQNPTHIYSAAGKYRVKLTAKNENGTDSTSGKITVLEKTVLPVAGFSSSVTMGYAPLSVQFTDLSYGAAEWKWDFGDGTTSTEQNPTHTYFAAGKHTVKLTIGNKNGIDSKLATITVIPVYAYITNAGSNNVSIINTATKIVTATVNTGIRPYGVAVSPDRTKVYVTNSGDGSDNSGSVSVIDTTTNTLTATLSAGNNLRGIAVNPAGTKAYVANSGNGSNDSSSIFVIDTAANTVVATVSVGAWPEGVAVNPAGTKVYVANMNSDNVSVIDTATNTVTATVNTGTSPHGVAVTPDGTKVYVANRDSSNVSVIDTATNNVTSTVPVGENPFGVTVTPNGTKAYVTNEDDNTVSVIDIATNTVRSTVPVGESPEGIAVTPEGNEVFVANMNSSNISVIDTATDSVTATVPVGSLPAAFGQFTGLLPAPSMSPVANFSSNITSGYAPLSVRFTDLSYGATGWSWSFGDGNNSTEQNPVHTYSTAGNYTVKLIAANSISTDSTSATITALEQPVLPVANFSSSVTLGPAPLTVHFTDLSENATEWDWNFGDGNSSTEQNPIHTYSSKGNYIVNLTAINANGTNSKLATIMVGERQEQGIDQIIFPVANFSSDVTDGPVPLLIRFTDLSQNATGWNWDFGDGTISSEQNPTHTFFAAGNYTINLTAANANGTSSKDATINVLRATPIITWSNPANITYGIELNSTQLNAVSSVPGTFNYTPGNGTVLSAGTKRLDAIFTPADPLNYTSASTNITINISQANPIIVWNSPVNITFGTTLNETQLNAIATSVNGNQLDGTFQYTLTDDVQAFGAILEAGTHKLYVDFTPIDATNYITTSNNVTINVTKANPEITWSNPADIIYGTLLSDIQLNASPSVPGTVVYTPESGTVLSAGENQSLHVEFIPTDTRNYNTTSMNVTINVSQANPTIAWNNPDSISYGIPLSITQLNAVANDPVTGNNVTGNFNYNPGNGTVLGAGTKILRTDFTPNDTANYTIASQNVTIHVNQANPTITVNNPENIIYGTPLSETQLNAVATNPQTGNNVTGNFNYNPGNGTVLSAGENQNLSVDFTPNDIANYTLASMNVTINVNQANPIITWSNPDNITYGTQLNSTQLDATATSVNGDQLNGTFGYYLADYVRAFGAILETGTHTLYVDFTPDDSVNYSAASKDVIINVSEKPVIPVANFSSDVTEDFVPFSVQFTDDSQNATGWNWDFGDGSNSTEQNPTHTYFSGGNYTVNLTVNNAYGTDSKIVAITAFEYYAFVSKWGSRGIDYGQFDFPSSVAVDLSGNIYVADSWNNRIQKFSSNGTFITKWGSSDEIGDEELGSPSDEIGDGQFAYPMGVAVDSSGYVYVADTFINRIQKFDSNGAFITKWGSYGSEDRQFDFPVGIAVDSSGNVYVADTGNNRTQKFDSDGVFITEWGSYGSEDGQFDSPMGIAVDSSNDVYVADSSNHRIQKFDSSGAFITKWGSSDEIGDEELGSPSDEIGDEELGGPSDESGDGQLDNPEGVAIDSLGNVYVADAFNHRIQKFAKTKLGFPVADFITNVNSGYLPLSVQFNDISKNATEWNWVFGDGEISTEQNPTHTYYGTGNYTVNLTVSNIKGTSSKTTAINVSVPQSDRSGGPDNFNYTFKDSNVTGGPTYDWIEISGTGTQILNDSDDAVQDNVDLGFFFNYYGTDFSRVAISSNGLLVSSGTSSQFENEPIGQSPGVHGFIAPFWDDLVTLNGGKVSYQTLGTAPNRIFVTEWVDTQYISNSGSKITFELILYEGSNNIKFQYKDVDFGSVQGVTSYDKGGSATVGIESPDGTDGLQYSFNEQVIDSGKAILFKYPQLPVANFSTNVTSGYVPLSVQFTDQSENATGWIWVFGDGTTSTEQNPTHTYFSGGNYTVNLTVNNANGTDSKIAAITAFEYYAFIAKWGSEGSGDGQFEYPMGIELDPLGNVYVVDLDNNRIQKFDSNGTFITKWGSEGSDDGQFFYPEDVAVDSSGNVYVADTQNNRIQKFDSNGNFITKWGSYGSSDGQFDIPEGIAVDSSGNVYVAELYGHRIQKFSSDGTFITKWGSKGSGDGQLSYPEDIEVDSSSNAYVADWGNNRIQKFDSNGNFITKWGSEGSDDGQFESPISIAADSSGNVYVADVANNRIQKFDSDGNVIITKWGSNGIPAGRYSAPHNLVVDSSGNVYVATNLIQKFAKTKPGFLVADFITSANSDYGPLTVQFLDSSKNATEWNWDFGDGFTSDEQSPAHTYLSAGTYAVTLNVSNAYFTDQKTDTITVSMGFGPGSSPVANFNANPTSGYPPLSVQFTDLSENAAGWFWDFGDGTVSTEQSPEHTFSAIGNYTVSLTATNLYGSDSRFAIINVLKPTGTFAYIPNAFSNTVSIIDTATDSVTATLQGLSLNNSLGVAVTPDGTKMYVTNLLGNDISVIDTINRTILATVPVGSSPYGVAVTPDGTKVYVTNTDSNNVSVIDTTNNVVTDTLNVGDNPRGVAVAPDGTTVYVANAGSNTVSVIDTMTNNITDSINVGISVHGGMPWGITITPDGTKVYVVNTGNNNDYDIVSVIDTASNTVITTINVGAWAREVAVNPAGTKVYVTNIFSDDVSVIDAATNNVTATVKVGDYPLGIAFTPDGTKVYVTNFDSSNVSVIDAATDNITSSVAVGAGPFAFGQFIGTIL